MGATLSSIYVEPVPDELGYELRNSLIDDLNGPGIASGATYRLKLTLSESSEGIAAQNVPTGTGTQTETVITRYNDRLSVIYTLIDAKTNATVTSGTETGLSAYNTVASPYATLAGRVDADKRAADDIAERIRLDLAIYFARKAKQAAP
jgi:LPS-assembly lipoprotein